jgi:hypothetical protein
MLVLVPAVAFSAPLPPPEATPEELPPMPSPPAVVPAPVAPPPGYGAPPYGYPQYPQYPQYPPPAPPYGYNYNYGYAPYGGQQPCYPQPACAQPAYPPRPQPQACCATDHLVPGGWRTVVGEDGAWYRERDVRKGNAGLIATGLVMWLGGWMGTGWGGTMQDGTVGAISFIPFLGPLISASIQSTEHNDSSSAGYVIGGLVQITGFVLFVAGAASKHVVRERQRISFGAAPTHNGFASNLSVRF